MSTKVTLSETAIKTAVSALVKTDDSVATIGKRVNLTARLLNGGMTVRSISEHITDARVADRFPGSDDETITQIRAGKPAWLKRGGLSPANIGFYARSYTLAVSMGFITSGDTLPDTLAVAGYRLAQEGKRGEAVIADTTDRVKTDGNTPATVETYADDVDTLTASGKGQVGKAAAKKSAPVSPVQAAIAALDALAGVKLKGSERKELRVALASASALLDGPAPISSNVYPGSVGQPSTRKRSTRRPVSGAVAA